MKILLTGGLGYIGSHTAVECLNAGYDVVIADDLSNSKENVVQKIFKITNKKVKFYKANICNESAIKAIFNENKDIFAVIHFAGYKAVGESVKLPLKYYDNNINSTLSLLRVMEQFHCNNLIFSSSATVYSDDNQMPLTENSKLGPTNPYGRTKLFNEYIIKDYQNANSNFNACILRYFNPIGAHESGIIGEDPNGIPNNLMPYICKVAIKELDRLNIFGCDYDTPDGTGIRDYIHVVDLAKGHLLALQKMQKENVGIAIYNLGTGNGHSVLEIVDTFNKVNGNLVKYEFTSRRDGDVAVCYTSTIKAKEELDFNADKTLEDMCKSSYNFNKNNKC